MVLECPPIHELKYEFHKLCINKMLHASRIAPLSFNQVLLAAQPTLCSLFLDVGCGSFRVLLWMGLGLRVNLGLQVDGHL